MPSAANSCSIQPSLEAIPRGVGTGQRVYQRVSTLLIVRTFQTYVDSVGDRRKETQLARLVSELAHLELLIEDARAVLARAADRLGQQLKARPLLQDQDELCRLA